MRSDESEKPSDHVCSIDMEQPRILDLQDECSAELRDHLLQLIRSKNCTNDSITVLEGREKISNKGRDPLKEQQKIQDEQVTQNNL